MRNARISGQVGQSTYPLCVGFRILRYLIALQMMTAAVNTPLWAQVESPAKGQWMDFFGDRETYLEVADNPSLNLPSQITIEMWMYPRRLPQLPTSKWQLVRKGSAYNLAIWRTGIPGQVILEMNRNLFIFPDGFEINTWNHIGGAYDRDKGEAWFYLNGKAHLLEGVDRQDLESQSSLKVGQQFDGGLDALRISNRVRYKGDYMPPMKHFEADLHTVLLWHFENRKDASKHENKFDIQGDSLRFAGTPYQQPVTPVTKLAVSWGQIKADMSR